MNVYCEDSHQYLADDVLIDRNRKKTQWVVYITLLAMIGEIAAGYWSGSMSLLTDGWHMASHAGALTIALLAYKLATSHSIGRHFSFGTGKLIPLGGYTSAIVLAVISFLVVIESCERFFHPVSIEYSEAIAVAFLGLLINLISAYILRDDHSHGHAHSQVNVSNHDHIHGHDHSHSFDQIHDHNLRSAFLHVLADTVTSLLAILALLAGKYLNIIWLDPFVGILGAAVILSWAYSLARDTGWELLDGHSKTVNWEKLRKALEIEGTRILDFHVWRIAPKAIACELVIGAKSLRGIEYYREILREDFAIQHIIVEERLI